MSGFRLLIGLGAVIFGSDAWGADAHNGEVLARRWCATCHLVASDQQGPAGEASPFVSMAKLPAFDAHRLAFFLLNPHPRMPDMGLTRREAEDLAAYIATLK
jgi:mono/diheme cytochrome c family protein